MYKAEEITRYNFKSSDELLLDANIWIYVQGPLPRDEKVDALIDEYAAGNSDFNDQVLTTLCKRSGLKLVTDDGDFKGRGIPIITANQKLLA
jgi:predicted nucleic acid-binding protein